MKVSVTEIQGFQRCRRQWDYSSFNRQSLGPIVPKTALSLGKTMHRAWAQWLIEPSATLETLFLHAATQELGTIRAGYLQKVGAPISDEELGPYFDGVELGSALSRNYETKWGSPLPEGFSIVQPEQQIEIILGGMLHDHVSLSEHDLAMHLVTEHLGEEVIDHYYHHTHTLTLSARLDGVLQHTRSGDLFILEHKTYSSRPKASILQEEFQFVAYEWALDQLGLGRVGGTAYDGVWKRAVPPRGSTFDDLFMRVVIMHPAHELAEAGENIFNIVHDMASAPRIYPNRRQAWQNGCSDCAFEELCTAQSRGDDAEWTKQAHFVKLDADKEPVFDE